MLTNNQLIATLEKLSTLSLTGVAFRVVQVTYLNTPLSSVGSILFGGRWNPPSGFSALYLADNSASILLIRSVPNPLFVLLSISYKLNSVIDITNLDIQQALGIKPQKLTENWRLMNAQGQIAYTQKLGEAAYGLQNLETIKVPSARESTAYNLVVFPDKLLEGSYLQVDDESHTINARLP